MGDSQTPDIPTPKHQRFQFDHLRLDKNNRAPMFRQLEDQLRQAIWQGLLGPGERLPSSRELASQLGVARNTVINAYEQLHTEGFLETMKGSGTRVTTNLPEPALLKKPLPVDSPGGASVTNARRFQQVEEFFNVSLPFHGSIRPFRCFIPAYSEFPKKKWTQLLAMRLRETDVAWMENTDPAGFWPLRQAIAGHLGAARGMSVEAQSIVVSAGAQQAIDLLAKVLIDPGDVVCFEEPCYTAAAAVFRMYGAKIRHIPVDDEGIRVEQLEATVKKAKLIYVTPSSHFPLGMTLSQTRRQELLSWARKTGALIIEDDYNGEYRYVGRPLPTLYAMAEPGRVIYLGSFSKLLFPALRLGYLAVPAPLVATLAQTRWLLDRHSPSLEQLVLTDFINEGLFARHLRRMRILYAGRQQCLLDAATDYLGDYLQLRPLEGGLHLIGQLQPNLSEECFLEACRQANVDAMPVSIFRSVPNSTQEVILGFAPFSEEQITNAVVQLQRALATA